MSKQFLSLIVLSLAIVASIGASVGNAQTDRQAFATNVWRSPSGNIACRYYPTLEAVTCETDNDQYAVAVDVNGGTGFRTYYRWIPSYAPVLYYGRHWTAPGVACVSSPVGMACSTSAGHGFAINRTNAIVR